MLTLSGLKHVSDQEKTHKNPSLRGQGSAVRSGPKPFASPAARPAVSATPASNQPPVFELDGKKWRVVRFWLKNSPSGLMEPYFKSSLLFCSHLLWSDQLLVLISCLNLFFSPSCSLQENQNGAKELVISNTEPKQVVYGYKCNNSVLQIKGKVNTITIGKITVLPF